MTRTPKIGWLSVALGSMTMIALAQDDGGGGNPPEPEDPPPPVITLLAPIVDIKPGTDTAAPVNISARGVIPVVIYSSAECTAIWSDDTETKVPFDATKIVVDGETDGVAITSVKVGSNPAALTEVLTEGVAPIRTRTCDCNGDDLPDLVLFFSTVDLSSVLKIKDIAFTKPGAGVKAVVTLSGVVPGEGETTLAFEGTDTVRLLKAKLPRWKGNPPGKGGGKD